MCLGLLKQVELLELQNNGENKIIEEYFMSLMYFNPVELLELSSTWEKKDHRTIFHDFEVVKPNQTAWTIE